MKYLIPQMASKRLLKHIAYWCAYVLFFTLIWGTYDDSYFKNLVIQIAGLPSRLILVYISIYYLFPTLFEKRNYFRFIISYIAVLILVSITIQRTTMLYFIQPNYLPDWQNSAFFKITEIVNTILDVNIAAIVPLIYTMIKRDRTIKKKVVDYEKKNKLQNAFISLKVEKTIIKVALKDIIYIESLKNYISVNTEGKTILAYKSLSALEQELLSSNFLRIHRSFIININYLESFSPSKIKVNNITLPIGRTYKEKVKSILNYK